MPWGTRYTMEEDGGGNAVYRNHRRYRYIQLLSAASYDHGRGRGCDTDSGLLNRIMRSLRDWGRDCVCPSGRDNMVGPPVLTASTESCH